MTDQRSRQSFPVAFDVQGLPVAAGGNRRAVRWHLGILRWGGDSALGGFVAAPLPPSPCAGEGPGRAAWKCASASGLDDREDCLDSPVPLAARGGRVVADRLVGSAAHYGHSVRADTAFLKPLRHSVGTLK